MNSNLTELGIEFDVGRLILLIHKSWDLISPNSSLTRDDKNKLHEIKEMRNKWAHKQILTHDATLRFLDNLIQILMKIGNTEELIEIENDKEDLILEMANEILKKRKLPLINIASKLTIPNSKKYEMEERTRPKTKPAPEVIVR